MRSRAKDLVGALPASALVLSVAAIGIYEGTRYGHTGEWGYELGILLILASALVLLVVWAITGIFFASTPRERCFGWTSALAIPLLWCAFLVGRIVRAHHW